jgi:ribose 5-phosphate isomerase B
MKIFIGADHRGFALKEKISQWLFDMEIACQDVGAHTLDTGDDYTKYAESVASRVVKTEGSRGVLLCGSGVGVEVVANKYDGVRAAIGKGVLQVEAGRSHDDMNVLVIAADFTSEKEAKAMLIAFLETKFSEKERYERRLQEIEKIEEKN